MLLTTLYEHFKRVTFSIFCTGMVFKSEITTFEIIVMAAILVATFFAIMMWGHNRKPNTYVLLLCVQQKWTSKLNTLFYATLECRFVTKILLLV